MGEVPTFIRRIHLPNDHDFSVMQKRNHSPRREDLLRPKRVPAQIETGNRARRIHKAHTIPIDDGRR